MCFEHSDVFSLTFCHGASSTAAEGWCVWFKSQLRGIRRLYLAQNEPASVLQGQNSPDSSTCNSTGMPAVTTLKNLLSCKRDKSSKNEFASAINVLTVIRRWSRGGILLMRNNLLFPSEPLSSLSLTLPQSEAFPQWSTWKLNWLQKAWRKAHVALEITLPYQLPLAVEDPLALASSSYRHISFLTFIIASNENCLII